MLSCGDFLLLTSGRGRHNYVEVVVKRWIFGWPISQDGQPWCQLFALKVPKLYVSERLLIVSIEINVNLLGGWSKHLVTRQWRSPSTIQECEDQYPLSYSVLACFV